MKRKWQAGILGAGLYVLSSTVSASAAAMDVQADTLRNEAVQLARGGKYDQSLEIMKGLEKQGYQEDRFWADYITILSWAGKDKDLLAAAEKRYGSDFSALPDYAALPLARTYLRTGQAAEGKAILQRLADRGNKEAKLAYAERFLYDGDYKDGQALYQEMAVKGEVSIEQLYYSQARAAMDRNDFIEAEKDFSLAKQNAPVGKPDYVRDIDAVRAAMYIQHRENDRAVNILRPYVEHGQATMNMISDFLTALRFDNKQKEAIADFKKYCPDLSKVPVYGLQNMADLYLRAGKYPEALKLYDAILPRADLGYVRMGRAYCLAMLGQEGKAFAEYQQIVQKYPNLQQAVAGDGTTFLRIGKLNIARKVYGLLGNTTEEKQAYQLQYANALATVDEEVGNAGQDFKQSEIRDGRVYYHESQQIFRKLAAEKKGLSYAADMGIAGNQVRKGLFADADHLLKRLNREDSENVLGYAANMANVRRLESEYHVYYQAGMDYQKNRSEEMGRNYQRYLGGNLYGSTGTSHHSLHDANTRTSYNQNTAGLSYRFDRGQVDAIYGIYSGDGNLHAMTNRLMYEFNDLATLSFSTGRRPHGTAGAVKAGIKERFHTLRWEQILNDRWHFGLEYDWNSLTDGNRYRNYAWDGTYALMATTVYRDKLLFSFSRGVYDWSSDTYDSPGRRIDFAGGWSRKWIIPRKDRTWEWITMLSWGHDNNDTNGFEPSTRLELTQSLKGEQSVVLGFEYGWRKNTNTDDTLNRRSTSFQFDINYNIGW